MEPMAPPVNVAYDLSRFDGRSRVREEAVTPERIAQQKRAKNEKAKYLYKLKAIDRLRHFMAASAAITAVVFLLWAVVHSTMQLSELTHEGTRLQRQIGELANQETLLGAQVENRINLAEIERIATEELGMRKPRREQVVYVDTSAGDYGVVHGGGDAGLVDRLWGRLAFWKA